jgi:hypothetical protein
MKPNPRLQPTVLRTRQFRVDLPAQVVVADARLARPARRLKRESLDRKDST